MYNQTEKGVTVNSDDTWGEYIDYLYTWANEHESSEYMGCCPICYDEWLDNEFDERK